MAKYDSIVLRTSEKVGKITTEQELSILFEQGDDIDTVVKEGNKVLKRNSFKGSDIEAIESN